MKYDFKVGDTVKLTARALGTFTSPPKDKMVSILGINDQTWLLTLDEALLRNGPFRIAARWVEHAEPILDISKV